MKKILKTLILIAIFSHPVSHAQLAELSMLSGLSEGLGGTTVETETETDIDDKETTADDRTKTEVFTDINYGYTGRSFVNPPKSRFSDEPLEYFGYQYFFDNPSTFAPLDDVPIPPDYIVGPNDVVKIILFGNTNKKYELKVTREGEIFIPQIGPLSVAGLTFESLRDLITQVVENQLIGTQSSITMGSLRSLDVFVLGAASNPGMYSISGLSSLTNAIIKSGGIDISGSLRSIKLKRKGKIIREFDFYDLLLNGDTSNDERLMHGDVVFIEPIGKTVAVRGEINRPGIYELKENETLSDLVKYSGNLRPKANPTNVDLTRINTSSNSFDLISINLEDSKVQDYELLTGDVLSVHPISNSLKNAVLLSGHAKEPGFHPWRSGMVISDLFKDQDDLLSLTDQGYVLIKRKENDSQTYSFLQVDLEAVFSEENQSRDLAINDQDEIILFPMLLTPDLITTKMIQDKYIFDEETNMMMPEDQWTSLTYLRKSLLEETLELDQKESMYIGDPRETDTSEQDIRRYYEYSIYEYCTIPEDLAISIIEESGFRAKKSVPIEDLEELTTPEDFLLLQQELERERIKLQEDKNDELISKTITTLCRNQLLDPIKDLVKRNNNDDSSNLVYIFGNVHFPGEYPFTKDMILSDAIKAAGGQKNATYESEIELNTKRRIDKKFITSSNFASLNQAKKTKLNPMDTIILKQLASSDSKTVEITGEVFFPGVYPIAENQTLSDLIERAGGVTDYGSKEAAYFQRQALKDAEKERLKSAQDELKRKILLSSQAGGLGQASLDSNAISQLTSLVVGDNEDSEVLGRLVIDLEAIIDNRIQDLVLEDGDTLHIPKKKQSVSVIGEVFVANSHVYKDEQTIEDYLALSGGVTSFADQSNLYLIKSDGSIVSPSQLSSGFFRSGKQILSPGDTIVVPLQVQPFSGIKATTEITQIIYQMALAAAAVNSF